MFTSLRLCSTHSRRSRLPMLRLNTLLTATSTFSNTVSQGSSEWFWNTMPRSGPGPLTSLPSRMTTPRLGSSRPAMMFSTVDLPQPEWPMMEMNSPWSMRRLMPLST